MNRWLKLSLAALVGAVFSSLAISYLIAWLIHSDAWAIVMSPATVIPPMLPVTAALHALSLIAAERVRRWVPLVVATSIVSAGLMLLYVLWMLIAWSDSGAPWTVSLVRAKEDVGLLMAISAVGGAVSGAVAGIRGRKPTVRPEMCNSRGGL